MNSSVSMAYRRAASVKSRKPRELEGWGGPNERNVDWYPCRPQNGINGGRTLVFILRTRDPKFLNLEYAVVIFAL